MLKILSISVGVIRFPKSPRIKSLNDRGRKLIQLLTGEAVSVNLSPGEATGAHLIGALGQGVYINHTIF